MNPPLLDAAVSQTILHRDAISFFFLLILACYLSCLVDF